MAKNCFVRRVKVSDSYLCLFPDHGQRWEIEHDGLVWTATEHPSPTALHVIIARDLDELERKIIGSELHG
jgi:hypothetical protein